MKSKLRVVFCGELNSAFSRLHYEVLRKLTQVQLWVASKAYGKPGQQRQNFSSARDWCERLAMRAGFEWRSLTWLRVPLMLQRKIGTPILSASRNDVNAVRVLQDLQPDLIVSAGFSHILSAAILQSARLGAFNCHPSPLPRYAGCDPWFWILRDGESSSAVTIHRMVADADAGGIVGQRFFPLGPSMNHRALYNRSSLESALLLKTCIEMWANGRFQETPQDLAQRSFFPGPRETDYRINWTQFGRQICDLVRACSPTPGAWTVGPRGRVVARRVTHVLGLHGRPGAVVAIDRDGLCIACADGAIRLLSAAQGSKEIWGDRIAESLGLTIGDELAEAPERDRRLDNPASSKSDFKS